MRSPTRVDLNSVSSCTSGSQSLLRRLEQCPHGLSQHSVLAQSCQLPAPATPDPTLLTIEPRFPVIPHSFVVQQSLHAIASHCVGAKGSQADTVLYKTLILPVAGTNDAKFDASSLGSASSPQDWRIRFFQKDQRLAVNFENVIVGFVTHQLKLPGRTFSHSDVPLTSQTNEQTDTISLDPLLSRANINSHIAKCICMQLLRLYLVSLSRWKGWQRGDEFELPPLQ